VIAVDAVTPVWAITVDISTVMLGEFAAKGATGVVRPDATVKVHEVFVLKSATADKKLSSFESSDHDAVNVVEPQPDLLTPTGPVNPEYPGSVRVTVFPTDIVAGLASVNA
jgi:hypothetical protein